MRTIYPAVSNSPDQNIVSTATNNIMTMTNGQIPLAINPNPRYRPNNRHRYPLPRYPDHPKRDNGLPGPSLQPRFRGRYLQNCSILWYHLADMGLSITVRFLELVQSPEYRSNILSDDPELRQDLELKVIRHELTPQLGTTSSNRVLVRSITGGGSASITGSRPGLNTYFRTLVIL